MAQNYRDQIPTFDEVRIIPDERVENYDVIRRFDHAMLEYFSMWLPFEDETTGELREGRVPFVFATPRREYSGDDNRQTAQVWSGEFDPTELERIVKPGMVLTRLDAQFDQSRWSYGKNARKLDYSSDLNMVMVSEFPLPYNFSYQIDFWAITYHDVNAFLETFARKFPRPTWWLDIPFPYPWGNQTVHMQSQGTFTPMSQLEGGEMQRDLRAVASVNVFGWIPLPPSWIRTIQRFGFDIIEESSQQILESYVTEWADKQEFWDTGSPDQVLEWS